MSASSARPSGPTMTAAASHSATRAAYSVKRRDRRTPEWTTVSSARSGMGTYSIDRSAKSMSTPWPARPPAQASGSMIPTGTPEKFSACWQTRAMARADPWTPRAPASATMNAALEDSPAPMGMVVSIRPTPPLSTWARAIMAPTSRAQGGSRVLRIDGSRGMSAGSTIPWG